MGYFILVFLGLILLKLLVGEKKKNNKFFLCCSITTVLLFFYMFRADAYQDMVGYKMQFERYALASWEWVLNREKDLLFYIIGKVVYELGGSFRTYIIMISIVTIILISYTIYRYSADFCLGIWIFVALGYYSFGLTGIRQALAMAIVIYSCRYIWKDRNSFIKFGLCIVLAACFHATALAFLVVYPLRNSNLYKYWWMGIIVVITLFNGTMMEYVVNYMHFLPAQYKPYLDGTLNLTKINLSGFVIQLTIFLGCNIFFCLSGFTDYELKKMLNILLIGVCIQLAASTMMGELFRVSMYFSVFATFAIPKALKHVKQDERRLGNVIVYGILLFYFCLSTSDFIGKYSLMF